MNCNMIKYLICIFGFAYLIPVCFGLNIYKRFLVNGNGQDSSSCFPPITWHCQLNCPNGYKNGANNCPICQCAPSSGSSGSMNVNAMLSAQTSNNQFYSNPCNPAQRFCPLLCTYGYELGTNGCQKCSCGQPPTQATIPTAATTKLTTMALIKSTVAMQPKITTFPQILSNPCYPDKPCNRTCPNGHLEGPNYCHYCICAPTNMNTNAPTTESTTTTVPTTTSYSPCVRGEICNGTCKNGFVKGPNNCTWCLCAPDYLVTTAATDRPKTNNDGHVSTTPSSKNTTTSSGDLSNQCYTAFTICQLRCKDGFIIDQNSCTNCVCKDDVYKAVGVKVNDEPLIKIMKPCVAGLDLCRIFCARGYLRGPQNCQFCACNN